VHDQLNLSSARFAGSEVLAFSKKKSQCILGLFGGTKNMVTGVKYVKE
jgi:hypothetical protein